MLKMDSPLCQESSIPWSKVFQQKRPSTTGTQHVMPSIPKKTTTGFTPPQPRIAFSAPTAEDTSDTLQSDTAGVIPKPPSIFVSDVIIFPSSTIA
jgi:hypothetical protein